MINSPLVSLPNLLIVDDDPGQLKYLEFLLKKTSINLIEAQSGFDALEKTEGKELALAIVDVKMTGMNGYELARKLNEARKGEKVPIIFLTANYVNEIQVFEGYDSGAVDYISKPVANHILLCKVNVFLDLFNQKQTIISEKALLQKTTARLTKDVLAFVEREEKYQSYIDNAPDGFFVSDETGRFMEANESASLITGYSNSELLQMSFSDLLTAEWLDDGLALIEKVVYTGTSKGDVLFRQKNGSERWLALETVRLTDNQHLCFAKDITDQKRAEEALGESEKKYRLLIENSHDIIYTCTANGILTFVSPAWTELLGHPVSDVTGKSFQLFVHPDDIPGCRTWIKKVIEYGERLDGGEYRAKHVNGTWCWHTSSAVPYLDETGATAGFYGIARDITEHRQAEKEKIELAQMHLLSQHTERVREEERVSIARELHDDLGQALTAVKIDLGIIRNIVPDRGTVVKINKVSALVGETIKTVQRITSELRPTIIDDLGLEAAIDWYSKEFAERTGLEVILDLDSGAVISPEASLNIFRIMQESLTNIARHSKATRVDIRMSKTVDSINFRITDNGIGIADNQIKAKKSFGIISMIERASSLGGKFEIYNHNGVGTEISLTVPLIIQPAYENSDL